MKKHLSVLLILLLACASLSAQRTVRGKVMDKDGPLAFVAIAVEGTTTGTTTGEDGTYKLEIPDGGEILIFNYIGYKPEKRSLGSQNTIDVTMVSDVFDLEEVVVTGYGTVRRKDITGSIASVSADDIADMPVVGVQNAMQGRAAGVTVVTNNGAPGAGINVNIRGTTSINASNQPLYIVDGVQMVTGDFSQNDIGNAGTNALSDLNSNDIESIEVLKDASSAAIYGTRGANGVVLITTKKGRAGRTKVSFNTSYGVSEATKLVDVVDADDYYTILDEQAMNAFGVGAEGIGIPKGTGNSDWLNEIFRTGNISDNNVSISGGDAKTHYYTSFGYLKNEGIIKNTAQDRYSIRLNLDHRASRKFKFGTNLGYTYADVQRVQNDNNIYGAVSAALLLPPDVPIYNEDGSYGSNYGLENPVAAVTDYQNHAVSNRVTGNFFAIYNLTSDLFVKANLGADSYSFREEVYEPAVLQSSVGSDGLGFLGSNHRLNWQTDYTLNYSTTFGKSALSAIGGTAFQTSRREGSFVEVTGYPTPDFTTTDAGALPTAASSDFTKGVLHSFFANANYSFDDRYILTATFRADGSSRVGVNNRFGYFPSAAAAWRISSESFMSGSSLVDDLKLRVGYGVTGNDAIGDFIALQTYQGGANYNGAPGISPQQLGNPDLRWEQTSSLNIGLDFTILSSRVSGSVDYYVKNTTDMLLARPIPTTSGFTSVISNVGDMKNSGIELSLRTRNIVGSGFTWDTEFNIASNKNEVVALFQDQPFDAGFGSRVAVGQPLGSFYGYVTDGIFQNDEEVANHATQPGAAPGDIRFKDLNNDGAINDEDRDFVGSAVPDLFGGVTNRLGWKGISLDFMFQFSLGNEILNNNIAFAEGMNSVFAPTQRAFDNRWTPDNPSNEFPRAVWGDPNTNRRDSDRFVEDGSYLRLKTASLSYSLPNSILDGLPFSRLRVYVSGQNLLTFTNYSFFDPEVSTFDFDDADTTTPNTAPGTDFLTYPQAKTIVFGANIDF